MNLAVTQSPVGLARACLLAFSLALAWLAGASVANASAAPTQALAEAAYIDQHPLELRALREPAEVLALLPAAFLAAERAGDRREEARLALAEANACRVKADWFCQRRAGQRAADAAKSAGDAYLEVRGLILLARGLASMSSFYEAERSLGRATEVLGEQGAAELHADIALAYSTISAYLGKHDLAADYAARGLERVPEGQRHPLRIRLLRNQAHSLAALGRVDEARAALGQAEALVVMVDDPKLAAEIWLEHGRLALQAGDAALAERMATRISRQGEILRNSLLRGLGQELAAGAALSRDDTAAAADHLQRAAQAFRALDQYRDEYRVVQAQTALAARAQQDLGLSGLLTRLDELTREVAQRERQLAADDFEDRLLYLRQESELTDATERAESARLRAEVADRNARLSIGIAAISVIAVFGMGYLALLLRRSARRLAEVEARRVQAMLRVGHDLRNPINGILGLSAALRSSGLPAEARRSVDAISSAAQGLVVLAQDLLDHGQLESGKLRLEVRPVDLPLALRNLARQYESRCAAAGLAFELNLDADVPRRVSIDLDRLNQVLGNLLGNALKFTAKGSIGLTVRTLQQQADRATIEIAVRDTGPGIAEAARERLMQPFEKGEAGKQHASGAGLGLSIASNLIALMGGKLELRSQLGEGTTFAFALTLMVLPDAPRFRNKDASARVVSSEPMTQLSVLVVDDDELNRQYHALLLNALACEPVLAADAEQAISLATRHAFDAALIDYEMQGVNGDALAQQLRTSAAVINPSMRLLMVSGHAPNEALGSTWVDGWLRKPLGVEALAEVLRPGVR